MKLLAILLLITGPICVVLSQPTNPGQPQEIERTIRQLEYAQCQAIVDHDTLSLYQLWANDFVVNTPSHQLATLQQAKGFIRSRQIDYSLYESHLESIQLYNNVAITMGRERIRPAAPPMASQLISRRYTQIWMKRNGVWQLVARHAHIQP